MKNCTSPYAHTSNPVFVVTNVILQPLIFGVGIIGNLLILVILNRNLLRTTSAIYVYLTGLAVCDLLVLMLAVPRSLRDMAVMAPELGYSKEMAEYLTYDYGFTQILKHSANWIIVLGVLVRYVTLASPLKKYRLTTISASRIIVFIIVVFCLVLNFPRFFELQVMELKHHCLERLALWDWDYTKFASKDLYMEVFPWVTVTAAYAIPFALMILLGILLAIRIRLMHVFRHYSTLTSAVDGNEIQMNIIVIILIVACFLMELPTAIAHVLYAVHPERSRHFMEYGDFRLLTNCLSLLHSCMNFILYMLVSRDFRKTFRRTFCCVCITGDEYYEPMTCVDILTCGYTYNRMPNESNSSRSSTTTTVQPDSTTPELKRAQLSKPLPRYMGPNVSKDGWI